MCKVVLSRVSVCSVVSGLVPLFHWWKRRGELASERRGGAVSWVLGDSVIAAAWRTARWGGRGDDSPHVDSLSGKRRGLLSLLGCLRAEVASQRRLSEAEEEGVGGSGSGAVGRVKARSTSGGSAEETEPFLGAGCSGSGAMPVDTYLRSVYVSNRGRVEAPERGPWQSSFLRRNTTREHLPTGPTSSGPGETANPAVAPRTSPASSASGGAEMSALARAFEKKVSPTQKVTILCEYAVT